MRSTYTSDAVSRRMMLPAYGGFVLIGVVTTMLGSILPSLALQWRLTDAEAGYFFAAQFLGSLAGVALSSRLLLRFRSARVLSLGYAVAGIGVAGVGAGTYQTGILFTCIYGAGLGLTIPTTNLLVASDDARRSAASLNLLNLAWGAGAVISPPLLVGLTRSYGAARSLLWLAALLAANALCLFACGARAERRSNSRRAIDRGGIEPARDRFALSLAASAFLYVGTETALGGWIAAYALRSGGSSSLWEFAPAAFWAALLASRAAAPLVLRRVALRRFVLVGATLAAVGVAQMLAVASAYNIIAGAIVAGAGLGPVFPNLIALITRRGGAEAARIAGLFFASAAVGGAVVPWAVGLSSALSGSLRVGLIAALTCNLLLLVLQLASYEAEPGEA